MGIYVVIFYHEFKSSYMYTAIASRICSDGTKKLLAMELLATQNGRETSKDFYSSNVFYVQGLQIRDKFLLRSKGLRWWHRPICTYDNLLFVHNVYFYRLGVIYKSAYVYSSRS